MVAIVEAAPAPALEVGGVVVAVGAVVVVAEVALGELLQAVSPRAEAARSTRVQLRMRDMKDRPFRRVSSDELAARRADGSRWQTEPESTRVIECQPGPE
jgi:hypothetical protein